MGKQRGFGSITPLPSGRFRARYTGPDLRRHAAPATFDSRLDAEAWLVDERRLISAGTWTSPAERLAAQRRARDEAQRNTFEAFAKSWLDGRHDLRPTTRTSYRTALDRHLLPVFGDTPLTSITTPMVRTWFASYGERTPTARAHAYQVLRTILAQAEDDRLIARNPARIKAGGKAPTTREPEVLTLPELLALADAMPAHHRALTLLSGFCGLRFGEAVALRRRDVDLDNALVRVRRGAILDDDRQKIIGEPKTRAGKRTVAMPGLVVDALREHLKDTPITGGRDALVFPGRNGEILAASALYGRADRIEKRGRKKYAKRGYGFYRARESIGRPDLHWHDLRRTAATLGAQSGATVKELQERLGHTTPAMALHYQQSSAERDRAIADRLQEQIEEAAR